MSLRTALLIVDALGLVGVIAFTVLAAIHPDTSVFLVGQIASAGIVLLSALWLRRLRNNTH
jgi:hypothetical protein